MVSLRRVPLRLGAFATMPKPHAHPGPLFSPRSRTLIRASLFVLVGSVAPGCDTPDDPQGSQDPTPATRSTEPRAGDQAPAGGVRVRVAGQLECSRCSVRDLEVLLGAKARKPLPKDPLFLPPALERGAYSQERGNYQWTVKFRDDLEVRMSPQSLLASELLEGEEGGDQTPNQGLAQLYSRRSGVELEAVEALRQRYQVRFLPEIKISEAELDELRERALRRSLVAQPDLAALYRVDGDFEKPEDMLRFAEELQALPEVEFVSLQPIHVPPPQDLPPKTTDFSGKQRHLGPDPGVNGEYAWEQGYFGEDIRITDCEGGWEIDHEDLSENPIQIEKGQKPRGAAVDHGTAVMGIVVAGHNGYGVKGLAPKAKPNAYPDYPNRRTTAITNALKDSAKGDIVMLELQTPGRSGSKFVPVEYDKPDWMATKTGTDAGVLVIAAAGNGNENLDADFYKEYMDRGDSGAIIVGAGTANTRHSKMNFSTYGKRVDVQGWGEKVVTTGYGDLKKFGGDAKQKYTKQFAGTSSATPIVVGSAALIQSFVKKEHNRVLSPKEMRELLKETGVAQGDGGHIGPLPDVKAAMEKLGKGKADEEAPKVQITEPQKDIEATLEKGESAHAFKVEVEATDNQAVKSVHLEVDGKKVGDADEEEPYIFDVELEEGNHKIVAVATDTNKNEGRSKALKAEVSPFEEKGESESGSPSESESESESASGGEPDSGDSDSKGATSQSDSDSNDDSGSDSEDPSQEGSDESKKQDQPAPSEGGGCAMRDSTPLPAATAFGLLMLAGLRRCSRRFAD